MERILKRNKKITQAELIEMFGERMPIDAALLLFDESLTANQIRERLREIANGGTGTRARESE